jgi:hypothetical protein
VIGQNIFISLFILVVHMQVGGMFVQHLLSVERWMI